MDRHGRNTGLKAAAILAMVVLNVSIVFCQAAHAGDPHSAYYSSDNTRIFWFIQVSDLHIGARGAQDQDYLTWLVNNAKSIIEPEFIVASGDLTDSTNGNLFGYPNGPWQAEWDKYKSILAGKVDASSYYDIPGNHDGYNDQDFSYYLANSVQGQASGSTQISWTRTFTFGTYHFIGVNSPDNTGASFSLSWPYGDYAGLDEGELAFIDSELALHQDAELTLIFGHHPVTDTGYATDTWLFYGAPEFVHYLDIYGASLYGYGHTHRSLEELFAGDDYTGYMAGDGVFYFNVPSLGKSTALHYSIIAIDCNGISSVTQAKGVWPVVLITTPVDKYLGTDVNPYSYEVPNSNANPIRALVFDTNPVGQVEYRIDESAVWNDMTQVPANPHLWEAAWDASALLSGDHMVEVRATSASGTTSGLITVIIESVSISGYVRASGEAGISGVVMNGLPGAPLTDASGYYIGAVTDGWSGTVTPAKTGYTFTPASRDYINVTSDQTNQDYTGSSGPVTVTFTSKASYDGWVRESTETSNVGGSKDSSSTGAGGLRLGDDYGTVSQGERQYKSIVCFDTSSIPDEATILSATLKLKRGGLTGTNPFTTHGACYLDIKNGSFGKLALEPTDFQAAATATQVATMSNPTTNGSLSTGTLNASGLAAINKSGYTQLRLSFSTDDNDDNNDDFVKFYPGDNGTPANRPVLEVTYQP